MPRRGYPVDAGPRVGKVDQLIWVGEETELQFVKRICSVESCGLEAPSLLVDLRAKRTTDRPTNRQNDI